MLGAVQTPWWRSSLVWDAVTSGGAGLTAPVFFSLAGTNGEATPAVDSKGLLLAGALLVGGSVLGGLLGYGVYGALRDKGWGPWKAGAMTGLIGGVTAAGALIAASLVTGQPLIPQVKPQEPQA